MALCRWPPEIAIGKLFADGIFFFADGFGPSANKPDPVVTHSSSKIFSHWSMTPAGKGEPSPTVTVFTGPFRASFYPVKAASMLTNHIFLPRLSSHLTAGIGPVTVLTRSPVHSSLIPRTAAL
jgi:hypothetical protein